MTGPGQDSDAVGVPDTDAGETRRLSRLMVLLLGCVTLLVIAAMVPLSVMARQNPLASAGTGLALGIPFGAVGVVVPQRQPGNPIGWLSLAFAVLFLLSVDAGFYMVTRYRLGQHLPLGPVMLFVQPLWEPVLAILPVVMLLFPEGRPPSPRWRLMLSLYAVLSAVFLAASYSRAAAAIAGHEIRVDPSDDLTSLVHGAGWADSAGVAAFAATLKDTVDLDSVRDDMAGVVQKVLEPAHLSVWLNERG